jgi:DNA polymerase III delta subunit
LKKSRFYVEKLYEQASNFTADELRDAVVRLAELDHALKGGSRLAPELEFDRALVELTRPRERVPAPP